MNRKQRRAEKKQGAGPQTSPYGLDEVFASALRSHQAGRFSEAERVYRDILAIDARHADALHGLGVLAFQTGRHGIAADLIANAIAQNGNAPAFHVNLGNVFQGQGKLVEAAASYRRALALQPEYIDASYNLGIALHAQGMWDEAVTSYRRVVALRPDYAEAHSNLGNSLHAQGELDEAVESYRRALAHKPGFAEAHYNLGVVLEAQGKLDEAASSYERALIHRPNYSEAHYNLGVVFQAQGKVDEAVASHQRALAYRPDFAQAHYNLGVALQAQGNLDAAITSYRQALTHQPAYAKAHSNILMAQHYMADVSNAGLLKSTLAFGETFERPSAAPPRPGDLDPARRLRIGYVSGDFRIYPVGYFLTRVLAAHDPDRVEVFCYSNSRTDDAMTGRLRDASTHWRCIAGMADTDAASLIRSDAIDILIDLSGHTDRNRLLLFTLRPAPIQASWLGYFGSTGLAAMDYVLMDAASIPSGEERWFREAVVRLPYGRFCYQAPETAPSPEDPPSLHRGYVTFGSFNNVAKISSGAMQLWAQVLQATPGSRLLLKWNSLSEEGARRRLAASLVAAGIPSDRLELRGRSPHADMLAEYGDVDIALDPFPFGGGLTSCEALWMGVPVLTLPGERPASRQTLGFLRQVGLEELVASSPADYVARAASLAADPQRLIDLRRGLRSRLAVSPMCDGPLFTAALESAFREMWRRFCSGLPVSTFDLEP